MKLKKKSKLNPKQAENNMVRIWDENEKLKAGNQKRRPGKPKARSTERLTKLITLHLV